MLFFVWLSSSAPRQPLSRPSLQYASVPGGERFLARAWPPSRAILTCSALIAAAISEWIMARYYILLGKMSDLEHINRGRTLGSMHAPDAGKSSRCPIRFRRLMATGRSAQIFCLIATNCCRAVASDETRPPPVWALHRAAGGAKTLIDGLAVYLTAQSGTADRGRDRRAGHSGTWFSAAAHGRGDGTGSTLGGKNSSTVRPMQDFEPQPKAVRLS